MGSATALLETLAVPGSENPEITFGEALTRFRAAVRDLPFHHRFTDDELEFIYSIGYTQYMQGRYQQAMEILSFIISYRPFEPRYLKAFGSCQQMCNQIENAIHTYSLVLLLDPDDVEVAHCCENCIKMQADAKATSNNKVPETCQA